LYTGHGENQARNYFLIYSSSPKPAVEVLTSPEKTDGGYELRSRGPASQGFGTLDIFYSPKDVLSLGFGSSILQQELNKM
jgi:hypothetical protein